MRIEVVFRALYASTTETEQLWSYLDYFERKKVGGEICTCDCKEKKSRFRTSYMESVHQCNKWK